MPRPCSICSSRTRRHAIEQAIHDGGPIRAIAVQHKVSRQAITRHAGHMKSNNGPRSGPQESRIAELPSVPLTETYETLALDLKPLARPLTLEEVTGPLSDLIVEPTPRDLIRQGVDLIEQAFQLAAPEDYEALCVALNDGLSGLNYGQAEAWE